MTNYAERATAPLVLTHSQIQSICKDFFGNEGELQNFEPLSGGAVNVTYKMVWSGTPYILRFYLRDPKLAEHERALYALLEEKVSLPKLLHSGAAGYPFAIFEFVNKPHVYEVKEEEALSYDLGKTLATIHSLHFPTAGLFGEALTIATPFEEGSSPYYDDIREHFLPSSLAWERLGEERAVRLNEFLYTHHDLFPTIEGGGVLVHSDFKPVNLLWDERSGPTVLDWEFAHSGHPLMDFGILLRHQEDFPCDLQELERGYIENGGHLPEDWVRRAHITDLINLLQLLNTPVERPKLFQCLIDNIDNTMENRG